MHGEDEGATRPFGRRRRSVDPAPVRPSAPPADGLVDMARQLLASRSGSLRWAVQTAAAAALFSVFATHLLARMIEPSEVAVRVAERQAPADPETTGALAPAAAARAVRLDPCAVAARPRL